MKTPSVLAWMVFAIALVAVLAYWDEERESAASLDDFAQEQAKLARGLGVSLAVAVPATAADGDLAPVLARLGAADQPGAVRVLVRAPSHDGLLSTAGTTVHAAPIEAALDSATPWVRLSRAEASELGLPARTAMAGVAPVDCGARGRFGVAVVATAQRERDRELRAKWRLVLGVVVASGLVLAFGGLALREQRRELELARDLAIAKLEDERNERLVRADKLATMGALATGIAHEVSTPLGVIVGRAEQLLPRVASDERATKSVAAIAEQAERIGSIVRGFLGLVRGTSPALQRVDPAELAKNALDLVEHRFARAGVALASDVPEGLPEVACEPRLFEQVLVNLLLNACDACAPGGSATLSLEARADRVAFVVVDDGAGITEEAAARATEPFFTTKPQGKGTGLGLAIANEIVKHHSGNLTIEPRAEGAEPATRGTRASVDIPAASRS